MSAFKKVVLGMLLAMGIFSSVGLAHAMVEISNVTPRLPWAIAMNTSAIHRTHPVYTIHILPIRPQTTVHTLSGFWRHKHTVHTTPDFWRRVHTIAPWSWMINWVFS
jgi:hypothetical protein